MKETFYFSHDYNTRSDAKIKKLIQKHNFNGYGLYWAIIEDLYQNNNNIELDYESMCYDYRTTESIIKSIIEDFELFIIDNNYFGSLSVQRRLEQRNEKSKTARNNANKRWGDNNSRSKAEKCIFYVINLFNDNESFLKCGITTESISRRYSGKTSNYKYEVIKQIECSVEKGIELENLIKEICAKYEPNNKFGGYLECYNIIDLQIIIDLVLQSECKSIEKNENSNAIKESKGKETKVNESKDKIDFYIFWDLYNKKVGAKKCKEKWYKLKLDVQTKIIETLPLFISNITDKKYQPNPETYLNNERWNDEIVIQQQQKRVFNDCSFPR